ncbi:YceI family protein, partial [bacterium]
MRRSASTAFLGLVSALVFAPALAFAAFTKTGTPQVTFLATGPGGLKIEGKTSELNVAEEGGNVKISVPLANVDTGINLRNKHMREKYLETDKFPNAELTVARSALQLPEDGKEVSGTANGQLTIHGQTKPVAVRYTNRRSGKTYDVQGSTRVNMNEYGVTVPSYLGVTVIGAGFL